MRRFVDRVRGRWDSGLETMTWRQGALTAALGFVVMSAALVRLANAPTYRPDDLRNEATLILLFNLLIIPAGIFVIAFGLAGARRAWRRRR